MVRLAYPFTIAACAALAVACGHAEPRAAAAEPAVATPVTASPLPAVDPTTRGRELVDLGGCHHCHTPMKFDPALGMPMPELALSLSGHPEGAPEPAAQPGQGDQAVIGATFTSFRLPFGVVYARNLTPDRETGLGTWTAEQFIQTMRTGHRKGDERVILPPMPWQNLATQSEADLRAIFSYLQSVPAIRNRVPEPTVPETVMAGIAESYRRAAAQGVHH